MTLVAYEHATLATCTARPSKTCKSPYVADIVIDETPYMAHTPALGMDGYISPDKTVIVSSIKNPKGSCVYSILAAYDETNKVYVGANPLHANKAFHEACKQGLLYEDFGTITSIVPEYTHESSRFDFFINDNFYVEVKSVLIKQGNSAIFPVGNKKKGTISERANKHMTELTSLAQKGKNCAIVFMVLREDVEDFKPNPKDTLFCEILDNAARCGVQVLVYQCKVDVHGIFFLKKLQ